MTIASHHYALVSYDIRSNNLPHRSFRSGALAYYALEIWSGISPANTEGFVAWSEASSQIWKIHRSRSTRYFGVFMTV